MSAVHVLCAGYAHDRVASTVVLIQDEGRAVIVDPGMVSHRSKILDPLASLGIDPAEVGGPEYRCSCSSPLSNASMVHGNRLATPGRT